MKLKYIIDIIIIAKYLNEGQKQEVNMMIKKHDYDQAWKTILEAFEKEIVELLYPEIYNKINW